MNRIKRLIRALASWLLATIHPEVDEVDVVVERVFTECGLNAALYDETFDLQEAHKLHEVLIHSARQLGLTLRTVGDVKDLLR